MSKQKIHALLSEYGSVVWLLLACALASAFTLREQHPVTPAAGRELARTILREEGNRAAVLIIARDTTQDRAFAAALEQLLQSQGAQVLQTVFGVPVDARQTLRDLGEQATAVDAVATNDAASRWGPLQQTQLARLAAQFDSLEGVKVYTPEGYVWPTFLTRTNLTNVVNQHAVIAILAIGMTMVIITAGIDLSVGSVLALCGVLTAVTIQQGAGGETAGTLALIGSSLLGIAACAVCGTLNGAMVALLRVPAFVATLGMMLIARGLALIIAVEYQSAISDGTEGTPEAVSIAAEHFGWLGNGRTLGVPNPILLMLLLYVLAHMVMTRTTLGRYIYAVGGNPRAARLSGVAVSRVLILVYAICAAMAGLGGVVDASRFEGGRPNAGELYELQVIAAVVVGGTSLAGGEGKMFGTLLGALIIAVIQNTLNIVGVKSYEQKVIFGLLILVAVVLDQLKKHAYREGARS